MELSDRDRRSQPHDGRRQALPCAPCPRPTRWILATMVARLSCDVSSVFTPRDVANLKGETQAFAPRTRYVLVRHRASNRPRTTPPNPHPNPRRRRRPHLNSQPPCNYKCTYMFPFAIAVCLVYQGRRKLKRENTGESSHGEG